MTGKAPAAIRAHDLCGRLAAILDRQTVTDGGHDTAIPQLKFWRFSNPTGRLKVLQQPGVYVVVQGRKEVKVGNKTYIYDPSQYLTVSLELPAIARVAVASQDKPYLCMTLNVDPRDIAALIVETSLQTAQKSHDPHALFVSRLEKPLLEALLRLVQLLDTPADIKVLAPLILKELHYRLLQGEQRGRLADIAIGDGPLRRVAGAITWIKDHFAENLQIDTLAKHANMSPSALHSHFKAATGISPIQYQKRLRLEEARRRLLPGGTTAEAVGYEVGYVSPSQFSREYARLFGRPPRRDVELMREAVSPRLDGA